MADTLVEKLKIQAFVDPAFSMKHDPAEIELQVNPQELQLSYVVEYKEKAVTNTSVEANSMVGNTTDSADGSSYKPQVFKGYKSPGLQIQTVIDATGVLPLPKMPSPFEMDPEKPSVAKYIEALKKTCYNYVSEKHGPPFLILWWGEVLPSNDSNNEIPEGAYRCQLEKLDVKYTLFSAKGLPVRAELDLTFVGVEDPNKAATGYSPDLSHIIDVQYGDNLPKLCKEIYGSPDFYMQIAKLNNLPSIYALEPGMKLRFPPLEKSSR